MMKAASKALFVCLATASVSLAVGCEPIDNTAPEPTPPGTMLASSNNAALAIYSQPYGPMDTATPNPIVGNASATAQAWDEGGIMRIKVSVQGFPPNRDFGVHLHKLACNDPMKAGGHYQHYAAPAGMATNPDYANYQNEAWLDFTTDATGKGGNDLKMSWVPRRGEAQALIFHHMKSGVGGASGAKLACLPMTGF
jgi:Cu-Zn family superoxide dismutase